MREFLKCKWLVILLLAWPLRAATPTFVQGHLAPSDGPQSGSGNGPNAGGPLGGSGIVPDYVGNLCFDNATQTNNAIVELVATQDTPQTEVTTTDSASNTYTREIYEVGNSFDIQFQVAVGTTSTQCLSTEVNTGGGSDQIYMAEFDNISTSSPLDTSCSASITSGTSLSCNMTTGTGGDLILACAQVVSFSSAPAGSMTWAYQSGWNALVGDPFNWLACQYKVQSASGSITPTITVGSAVTAANFIAMALKSSTAGSTPSAATRVVSDATFDQPGYSAFPSGSTPTVSIPFPCGGLTNEQLWMTGNFNTNSDISSISDSNLNTWNLLTAEVSSPNAAQVQFAYTSQPTTCSNSEVITIHYSGTMNSSANAFAIPTFFDIAGSGGYDSSATCGTGSPPCGTTGTQSSFGSTISDSKITPSKSGGIILGIMQEAKDTVVGTSIGTMLNSCYAKTTPACSATTANAFVQSFFGYEDEGLLLYYPSNTNQQTLTYTYTNTQSTGQGAWYGQAISILPQAASGSCRFIALQGVGCK